MRPTPLDAIIVQRWTRREARNVGTMVLSSTNASSPTSALKMSRITDTTGREHFQYVHSLSKHKDCATNGNLL